MWMLLELYSRRSRVASLKICSLACKIMESKWLILVTIWLLEVTNTWPSSWGLLWVKSRAICARDSLWEEKIGPSRFRRRMAWFISKEFLEKQLRDSLNWILMPTTAQSYQVSTLPLWHSFPALPKSQIIVLIAAYKVACSATHFNFESVLQKYKSYMASHIS